MREYARVAWTFLNHAGYINFGVAPAIAEEALGTSQTKGSVIIIGAGMAGKDSTLQRKAKLWVPHCRTGVVWQSHRDYIILLHCFPD